MDVQPEQTVKRKDRIRVCLRATDWEGAYERPMQVARRNAPKVSSTWMRGIWSRGFVSVLLREAMSRNSRARTRPEGYVEVGRSISPAAAVGPPEFDTQMMFCVSPPFFVMAMERRHVRVSCACCMIPLRAPGKDRP